MAVRSNLIPPGSSVAPAVVSSRPVGQAPVPLGVSTLAVAPTPIPQSTAPVATPMGRRLIPQSIQIAVINECTRVSDTVALQVCNALQVQVDRDFYPIWGIDAALTFYPKGVTPPASAWWLVLLDHSDQAGALGYHDLTPAGAPLGKVFVLDDMKYGLAWSVTASHELLEMLVDPYADITVFAQNSDNSGLLYAYESCDACEDDQFAYAIGGVKVSDFVTPAWFEQWRQPYSAQFDFKGHITAPFQLLPGGYIGLMSVAPGAGWTQKQAQLAEHKRVPAVGSRRDRRANPGRKIASNPA